MTMEVGHKRIELPRRIVTLLDAPGHQDFIPQVRPPVGVWCVFGWMLMDYSAETWGISLVFVFFFHKNHTMMVWAGVWMAHDTPFPLSPPGSPSLLEVGRRHEQASQAFFFH